jgi:hypothetical protein
MQRFAISLFALLLGAGGAFAQAADTQSGDMPGMDMGNSAPQTNTPGTSNTDTDMSNIPGMDMSSSTGILGPYPMTRDASGTSWQPDAATHHGLHAMEGDWMFMGHLRLTGIYDTQSGPRGDEKFFLAGMLMGAARRDFSDGDTFNLRAMLSPDPFMGKSGYPLLLATGETANGTTPLIDRQHPHDLFMELAASYSHKLSDSGSVFLYAGYPGEPALGPPAFMHRVSALDIPDAPISHHWLDSTHVTFGVLTAGFVEGDWKLEVSRFTGREPDQHRFNFDPIKLDSTSARLSWNPDANWSLQISWGDIKSPEQLEPAINETRTTASATYVLPLGENASFAATAGWGLKHLSDGTNLNAAFLEEEYKPSDPWTIFARAEWEENAELAPGIARVGKLSLGAIHDWQIADHLKLGLGGLYAFDFVPSAAAYGGDPHGAMAFLRLLAK